MDRQGERESQVAGLTSFTQVHPQSRLNRFAQSLHEVSTLVRLVLRPRPSRMTNEMQPSTFAWNPHRHARAQRFEASTTQTPDRFRA
jgi:hypothetical protein